MKRPMKTASDMRSDGLKQAWAPPKNTRMEHPKRPSSKGSGLARAWEDQTAKPSLLTNMNGAKERVR
jgi:hypothetical protein